MLRKIWKKYYSKTYETSRFFTLKYLVGWLISFGEYIKFNYLLDNLSEVLINIVTLSKKKSRISVFILSNYNEINC